MRMRGKRNIKEEEEIKMVKVLEGVWNNIIIL